MFDKLNKIKNIVLNKSTDQLTDYTPLELTQEMVKNDRFANYWKPNNNNNHLWVYSTGKVEIETNAPKLVYGGHANFLNNAIASVANFNLAKVMFSTHQSIKETASGSHPLYTLQTGLGVYAIEMSLTQTGAGASPSANLNIGSLTDAAGNSITEELAIYWSDNQVKLLYIPHEPIYLQTGYDTTGSSTILSNKNVHVPTKILSQNYSVSWGVMENITIATRPITLFDPLINDIAYLINREM
jgi:hypothetical protein